MHKTLKIQIGQSSDSGPKALNQDFFGALCPKGAQLTSKGVALALADGISTSQVSQTASETVVSSFLSDYYCTPESWTVKTSVHRVVSSANAWLYAQTKNSPYRYDKEKGYICTFAAMVFKSNTAHVFHCGDSRIFRLHGANLEQLTEDHKAVIDSQTSYLTRAIGIHNHVDMDYKSLQVNEGDTFVLATDGVYEFLNPKEIAVEISEALVEKNKTMDQIARDLIDKAIAAGSDDNLTLQIAVVDTLPDRTVDELQLQAGNLPIAPLLTPRMEFDGYRIVRELYISSRSHVFVAEEISTGTQVALKTPSGELRESPEALESFLMEDWVAQRIDNIHVLRAHKPSNPASYLYSVTEFVDGQTLTQWMEDNPRPSLDRVRNIIGQIGKGLRALHRQEMIHQDLRPNNIMIDHNGTVKIIDFGTTHVAGIAETEGRDMRILGTAQFTAPEYFLGEQGGIGADVFSLGVIAYKMLSGNLPYGADVAKTRDKRSQMRLRYRTLNIDNDIIPDWVEYAIAKAVHVDPKKRYQDATQFVYELSHKSSDFSAKTKPPLIERDPVKFWQSISLLLAAVVVYLVAR